MILPCGHDEEEHRDYRGVPWVTDGGRHLMCRVCWLHWNGSPFRPVKAAPKPPPLPVEKWPWKMRVLARFRKPEDRGAGDTLARKLGTVGEKFKAAAKALGFDCGCPARQAAMNAAYPYPPEPTPGTPG